MVDQTDNFVRGSTDSSVTSTDTSISVVDASVFPDPTAGRGEYNLVFWNDANGRPDQDADAEIIRVTGRDTTAGTLTVLRGQETTTAASHPSDSALQLAPTAKVIDDIVAEKADTDRAVEDFTTNGAADTIPISQGGGSLAMGTIAGRFSNLDVFETDGSFDATGIDTVFVECVGGGGGGGDVVNNGVDTLAVAAGGGGGGYAASYVDVSNTSSVTVTIGTGGNAGAPPGNGLDTTFGSFVTAAGGGAGEEADDNSPVGGLGGGGSGDITVSGGDGMSGSTSQSSFSDDQTLTGGAGGKTVYGHGAESRTEINDIFAAKSGKDYGGGGGGAINSTGIAQFSVNGGAGADGVVIVHY